MVGRVEQCLFELWKGHKKCKKGCRCTDVGKQEVENCVDGGERLETRGVARAWKPGGETTTRPRFIYLFIYSFSVTAKN